jgi:hypothetical protein
MLYLLDYPQRPTNDPRLPALAWQGGLEQTARVLRDLRLAHTTARQHRTLDIPTDRLKLLQRRSAEAHRAHRRDEEGVG